MKKFTSRLFFLICAWLFPAFLPAQEPLPFYYDFSGTGFSEGWTIVDGNDDGKIWYLKSGEATYSYDRSNPGDDWMITPGFGLEKEKTYRLTFDVKTYSSSTAENLKVMLGNAPAPEAQTRLLADLTGYRNSNYTTKEILFSPDATETGYIGFYAFSEPNKWYIYIDNVRLEEIVPLPAPITDLSVTPGAGGLPTATLTWTNPDKDQTGNDLTELSGIDIYREGSRIYTVTDRLTPGQEVSWQDTGIAVPGKYRYKTVACNSAGEAPGESPEIISPWIGEDLPGVVSDITLSSEGFVVSLAFRPPAVGMNGGWIDTASLAYRIVRQPGEILLEESYTGVIPYTDRIPDLGVYYYEITSFTRSGEGSKVTTENIVAGETRSLPFSVGFDTENDFHLFTVIDNDRDDRTWEYDDRIQAARYTAGNMADDWLITPAFALENGKSYKIGFDAKSYNYTNSKRVRVTIGTAPAPETQNRILLDTLIDYAYYHTHELLFCVEESGKYHIGFQCYDDPKMLELWIDNISLEETATVPAAVTDIHIVPDPEGTVSATVTWKNSTVSRSGAVLQALSKAEVYRNDNVVHIIPDPVAGAVESFTDMTIPAAGKYIYRIVCSTEEGAGETAETESGWIGPDTPLPVTELLLTNEDGIATLSFDAPAGGENGGWIDRKNMAYTVRRQPDDRLLTSSLKTTGYTDDSEKPLATYTYTVTAITPAGESAPAVSNPVVFGDAMSLPYTMNFDPEEDHGIWTTVDANNDGRTWLYNEKESRMEYTHYSVPDDWLFTPPFSTTRGKHTLETNVKTGAMRDTYKEQLKITLGQSADPETHTLVIADTTFSALIGTTIQRTFDIPWDGSWYIGFRLYSNDPWGFYMNSFSLRKNGDVAVDPAAGVVPAIYYRSSPRLLVVTRNDISGLQVSDMCGRTVLSVIHPENTVDLEDLPAGLYVIRYETENGKCEIFKQLLY